MTPIVITPPDALALLPLDTLRVHCRIDGTADDPLLTIWVRAALGYAQHYTGTSIGAQTLEVALADWPGASGVPLPCGPVTGIVSVHYLDAAGAEQQLPSEGYRLSLHGTPRRWRLTPGAEPPPLWPDEEAVRIRYICGASEPPAATLQAMLLLVDHADKNRGAVVGGSFTSVPFGVDALLDTLTDYTGRGG
nr:phage head-tail connector protein [Variovorax boronicumulans]